MNVTIIGTGYVGLVTGVCIAAKGHNVICIDIDSRLVSQLNSGIPHIYELDLEEMLKSVLNSGRFRASIDLEGALDWCDIVIIAVGTPSKNGIIDLTFILEVVRNLGEYLKLHDRFLSIVVKSTTIPGTTDTIIKKELEKISERRFPAFGLGMNPEFLREGVAISDFMKPDRIVLGYEDGKTLELLDELYAPWDAEKIKVNTRSAELIKYANNALLAVQISAINEIANLAATIGGIDFMDIVKGIHMDKRWSPVLENTRILPDILTYLIPGCGFGGSCLPKDVQALRAQGIQNGLPMHMLNAVLDINDSQPYQVIQILEQEIHDISNQIILVLGLAFKPGTDDVRESASIRVIKSFVEKRANIFAYDPVAIKNFKVELGAVSNLVTFVEHWTDYVERSNIVVITTNWPEFHQIINLDMTDKILFDARRMFQPSDVKCKKYLSIGYAK